MVGQVAYAGCARARRIKPGRDLLEVYQTACIEALDIVKHGGTIAQVLITFLIVFDVSGQQDGNGWSRHPALEAADRR